LRLSFAVYVLRSVLRFFIHFPLFKISNFGNKETFYLLINLCFVPKTKLKAPKQSYIGKV